MLIDEVNSSRALRQRAPLLNSCYLNDYKLDYGDG
jgi:hypothetical protein